ncbi:bola protein [Ochromonadaceae sp. CCMP2298]|nr:bola protein [Ochromonadaceae sp. CCMP2298]
MAARSLSLRLLRQAARPHALASASRWATSAPSLSAGLRPTPFLSSTRLFSSEGEDTVVSTCTKKIADLLSPVHLKVTSSNDDPNGSHIQVEVVSAQFEGKNTLARQRLVYKAIWEEMNGPVHAVDSIVAKTPKEVGME